MYIKEQTYLPKKLTDFKSIHDGNWYPYKVEMLMKRALKVLKIQPPSGEGMIELRNIELVSTDDHYIRDWPLY